MSQTIALVDDDRNLLTSVQMALEKEGFKVQTYIDGENALVGLSRTPPDLAVIDIKMPRMDGEELLKKIAEQEAEIERRDAVVIKMAEKYQLIEKDDFAEEIERDVDSYNIQETTEPKKD